MKNKEENEYRHEPREIPGFLCVSFTIESGTSWRYIPVSNIVEIILLTDGGVQIDYREHSVKGYRHILITEDIDTVLDRLEKALHPLYTVQSTFKDLPDA